jgi:hypothetical protein
VLIKQTFVNIIIFIIIIIIKNIPINKNKQTTALRTDSDRPTILLKHNQCKAVLNEFHEQDQNQQV